MRALALVHAGLLVISILTFNASAAEPDSRRDVALSEREIAEPARRETRILGRIGNPRGKLLASLIPSAEQAKDIASILATGKPALAIIDATPKNLEALAQSADKLRTFAEAGGWMMLWGLTPEGLPARHMETPRTLLKKEHIGE